MGEERPMRYCPQCATPLESRLIGTARRPCCPACSFVYFADPKVAVAIVVRDGGKVLLGRRVNDPGRGRWALPAGFVDRGEALTTAAAREAHEELGVDVTIGSLLSLHSADGDPVILAVYAATIVAGPPVAGDDLDAVGYFSSDDLPELAFPRDAEILRAALPSGDPGPRGYD
jgi:ADP-ribose pyrophosphatase YjhB (NUDIX family)